MDERLVQRRRWRMVGLVVLFLLAVGVRLIRARQEVVANPDIMRYVDQAQGLGTDFLGTLRSEVYHPLHAGAARVVHGVIGGWFENERMGWLWSLRWVSLIAGAVVTVEVALIARLIGAPYWAGMAAGVAFLLNRRTGIYGSDGLSDMLMLALFGAAMVVGLRALREVRRWWRWGVAGMLAGASYLGRPEGMGAAVILVVTLVVMAVGRRAAVGGMKVFPRRRLPIREALVAAALVLAGAGVMAVPYMAAIGRVTGKVVAIQNSEVRIPKEVLAAGSGLGVKEGAVVMFRELTETFSWAGWVVLVGGVLLLPRLWGRARLRVAVVVWVVVWGGVMGWLLGSPSKGYLDGRHTMPLMVVLFALLGLALVAWRRPMVGWMERARGDRDGWNRMARWRKWRGWPTAFALIVFGVSLVPGVVAFARPPREDKGEIRAAAAWIDAHAAPDVVVCDFERLVGYYSGRAYTKWWGKSGRLEPHQLEELAQTHGRDGRPARVIAALRVEVGKGTRVPSEVGGYRAIAWFASGSGAQGEVVVLYAKPGEAVLKDGAVPAVLERLPF